METARTRAALTATCACVLALAACGRGGQDEMGWARAALDRNATLEVVAADPQSRTFTVRMKGTGELRMVRADQLVAGPAAPAPSASAPAAAASTAAPAVPPAPAPAGPAGPGNAAPAAAPAPATAAREAAASEGAAGARQEAAAGGPAAGPIPRFVSAAVRAGPAAHTVPGQVLEAGPGYTIEAGAGASPAPPREPSVTSAAVEVRHEPIVCQGARLLHIDNLNLQFEGDAVSAEDGCEIHITNSRITATGIGVQARAANVHIDNSLIEGDTASIDASDGAQIYAASSRFRGLSRRLDTAAVHDLGGNVWN
jgi:hypothetical protein